MGRLIGEGQYSDPGRTCVTSETGCALGFKFYIWNEGDLGNFPSGGSVTSEFKLLLDEKGDPLRFAVDRREKLAAKHP